MKTVSRVEAGSLIPEIERYLAAVELFRAEGCEPEWSSDPQWLVLEAAAAGLERG